MENLIKENVRHVIEEMNTAYHEFSDYHYMNADYANFAGMALARFRDALRNPELTGEELEHMLRGGMNSHRTLGSSKGWSEFVASYVTRSSNINYNQSA